MFAKTGTPPAITLSLPSFGDLGTGRPGIPLFNTRPTTLTATGHVFGNLGTGRPGLPSLTPGSSRASRRAQGLGTSVQAGWEFPFYYPAHHALRDRPRFWGPWYRQAGNPLLYTGTHRRQRRSARRAFGGLGTGRPGFPSFIPHAGGSPRASAPVPRSRPTRLAAGGRPPDSATGPGPPGAPASSRSSD